MQFELNFSFEVHHIFIRSFRWVLNAPTIRKKAINKYVDILDSVLCGNLLSEQEESYLYQVVKTVQIHGHSKTCRKNKNTKNHNTDKTIIAIPLQNILRQVEKCKIVNKRTNILGKLSKYIDSYIDPNSTNFSNDLSIQEILPGIETQKMIIISKHLPFHQELILKFI